MRRRARRTPIALAALVAACATAADASAQSADQALDFEDRGWTELAFPEARAYAISAPVALASDVSALIDNPAGLSRIKRPHAVLALGWRGVDGEYLYGGAPQADGWDASGLSFVGAALPIPVLRGSLVPAASVHRAFTSDLVIRYRGYNVPDGRDDTFLLQQSGTTYAYTLGLALDVADNVSIGAAVSLLAGGVDVLRQYDTHAHVPQPPVRTFVLEDARFDVLGVAGRIGLMFYPHRHLHFGLVLTSRQPLELDGTVVTEVTTQVTNDVGSFSRERTSTSTEYVLPFRVDAGVALPWGDVALAAQVGYSDWTQATIGGHRISTQGGGPVLRDVVDVRGGIEWTTPVRAVRLRAGVAHARAAAAFLQADRIDNDRLEPVSSESGRTRVSLGAGWVVGPRMVLGIAYERARRERAADTVGDTATGNGVVLQGSYWF